MLSPDDIDFRAVAEQAPVAWSVLALDGHQLVGNQVYAELFGYDLEEINRLRVVDLTHPDDRSMTDDYLSRLIAGEIDRHEVDKRYVRKDGSVFVGHLVASLMRDDGGAPKALVGVITDVTAERRLGEQVEQSEQRLSKMLTNISDTVTLIDAGGTIQGTTGFHKEILGYPLDFWSGQSVFDLVHPDQADRAASLAAEVLGRPGAEVTGEFRVRHHLGHYEDLELAAVNLLEDPAVEAVVITTRNVTERKRQERELVRVRDRALKLAEQRSSFVAHVSHELRTPLHAVLGLAELLIEGEIDTERRSLVEGIRSEATRLRETVDDLLDHTRVEADRLELEPQPVDLRELVDAVVRRNAAADHAHGLQVEAELDESVPAKVMADAHRLDQILTNLVGNAVKFTTDGSVRLTVDRHEGAFRFEVRDTGPGVPVELRAAVFEPFTQVPGTGAVVGGSGLGLALVRGLVELMGGSIELSDNEGGGALFRVLLPLVDADEDDPSRPADDPAVERPPTGARVLVVEDNEVNQMLVRQQLARLGHSCDVAGNGSDALALLAPTEHGYDLVLMDWQLPDIDGLETTRRLRRLEGDRPRVPVIAVTASAMPEDRAACRAAGMDDFLPKPVAMSDLAAMIGHWVPGEREVEDERGGHALDRGTLEHLVDDLGDRSVVVSLVSSYLAELDTRAALLEAAQRDDDLEVVHRVGHTLRSTSQMLGALGLVRACRALEAATETTDVGKLMEEFDAAAAGARTELERWIRTGEEGTS